MRDVGSLPLDPLTLPLQGSRLIEASAGTGKTWTIAALYVRLVLGHGTGPGLPLLPAQILVMTFTKAATRELSHRIRERLVEAAAVFRGRQSPRSEDAFLAGLLAEFPAGSVRTEAAWRLAMAAESMDEAAIFTIDAWCQRMLREHAFESGALFDEELQPNEAQLVAEAAADYWRQQVYPLDGVATADVLDVYGEVAELAGEARQLLGHALPAPDQDLAPLLEGLTETRRRLLVGWTERVQRLRQWFDAQLAAPVYPFHGNKVRRDSVPKWLDALTQWVAAGGMQAVPAKGGWRNLGASHLEAARARDVTAVPLPPECAELDRLLAVIEGEPPRNRAVQTHAAGAVAARLRVLKQARRTFGFADLLERLDVALGVPGEETGRPLRARIREQFPVALVDEFQDTSPRQLAILDKIYRLQREHSSAALLLIGDPKQSIYGFRGADIHSYLAARRATSGRHHTLPTNYRSTRPMVEAVNALFARAEARAEQGAFGLRSASDAGLPFHAVLARGRKDRLLADGEEVPPLTFCVSDTALKQSASEQRFARLAAWRLAAWLRGGGGCLVGEGESRPLRAADCVVLVRTRHEAAAMRRALHRVGLRSVYLSEGDSVFATEEAEDLLRLLLALCRPGEVGLVRAALATHLFGRGLDELRHLAVDEEAFDEDARRLRELRETWQQRGVLAMVRELLHGFEVPSRWLGDADGLGERRLTNLLHLGELLQAAAQQLEGETALVHWLATQVTRSADVPPAGGADDPQLLRLESDAELIRIITIHKSKGLEYPVVILPFATHFRRVGARGRPRFVFRHDGTEARRRLVLAPRPEDIEVAEAERLREDVRLLYVALTRAQHAVWVGAPCILQGNSSRCVWAGSALGQLLPADRAEEPGSCVEAVRDFVTHCATSNAVRITLAVETEAEAGSDERQAAAGVPSVTGAVVTPVESTVPAPLEPYRAEFERWWTVHSYSALVRDKQTSGRGVPSEPTGRVLLDDEPDAPLASAGVAPRESPQCGVDPARPQAVRHLYPAGAVHGDFLHKQLEWLAGEGFALDAPGDSGERLRQELLTRCERAGQPQWARWTLEFLAEVCHTPLRCGTRPVALVELRQPVPEMEFWMPAEGLSPVLLDRLCRQHVLPGLERPALTGGVLSGLMKGVIDLVFEHDGRFFVLDYKSNRLGSEDADYTGQAMAQAVAEHRYDVQAVVYLLALHRLLRARLGASYRPRDQLGGALYLFMRGIAGPEGGSLMMTPPWEALDILDALIPGGAGS